MEAFSGGVLAIVVTLLVLELDPPSEPGAMLTELVEQWPGYLAYLASFGYVAVIWVNHHELFTRIRVVDVDLLWRNLLLLLTTSFLPFPTAVLSTAFQHGTPAHQAAALVLYCVLAAAMGTSWLVVFKHLCHHPRLLGAGTPPAFFAGERRRPAIGIAAYAVAAGSDGVGGDPRPGDRSRPARLLRPAQPGMGRSPSGDARKGRGRARRRLRRPASTPPASIAATRGTAALRVFLMVSTGQARRPCTAAPTDEP